MVQAPVPSGGIHSDCSVPMPAGLAIKDCGYHQSPQPRDAGTDPVLSPFIFWFFQTYIHTSNTIMHTEELAPCIGILWGMSQEHTAYISIQNKLYQMRGLCCFHAFLAGFKSFGGNFLKSSNTGVHWKSLVSLLQVWLGSLPAATPHPIRGDKKSKPLHLQVKP